MAQPQHPAAQQAAPHKRKRVWPWIVLAVVVIIGAIAVASGNDNTNNDAHGVPAGNEEPATAGAGGAGDQADSADPAVNTVIYRVTGTSPASMVTYSTDGLATINQEANVTLPWTKTITLPNDEPVQVVQIDAQGNGSGKVNVTITVNGKLIKEAHADGYGVAAANADIGTLH
jgi:hypothetical protein